MLKKAGALLVNAVNFRKKVLFVGEHVPRYGHIRLLKWTGDHVMRIMYLPLGLTLFHYSIGMREWGLKVSRPSEMSPKLKVFHLKLGRYTVVYHQ